MHGKTRDEKSSRENTVIDARYHQYVHASITRIAAQLAWKTEPNHVQPEQSTNETYSDTQTSDTNARTKPMRRPKRAIQTLEGGRDECERARETIKGSRIASKENSGKTHGREWSTTPASGQRKGERARKRETRETYKRATICEDRRGRDMSGRKASDRVCE